MTAAHNQVPDAQNRDLPRAESPDEIRAVLASGMWDGAWAKATILRLLDKHYPAASEARGVEANEAAREWCDILARPTR